MTPAMRTSLRLSGVCLLMVALPAAAGTRTLIHAGRVIDGASETVTVTIEGDRIVGVTSGYAAPQPGDTVIDLRSATLMPGLMDIHVHISSEQSGAAGYAERFYLNPADMALRATTYASRTLMAGFTTVRDCGAGDKLNLAMRDAVAKGWVIGPRVVAAGGVTTTGGHGDSTNGLATELQEALAPRLPGTANGADEIRAAVRQRYKDGADFIKIAATGGVLSLARSGQAPRLTEAELAAVVETARDNGMTVAAHAHGTEGMLRAVRAGVHSIEHGTYMSDEVMAAMKQKGTYYLPTISAGKFVAEKAKIDGYFPEVVRPKAAEIGPQIQDTFGRAYKAGVKIAFGTDPFLDTLQRRTFDWFWDTTNANNGLVWGLTACIGPQAGKAVIDGREVQFHRYWARGASSGDIRDDGTIAPTAAGGSLPFAPDIVLPALEEMQKRYGERVFRRYGFVDAFNPTFPLSKLEAAAGTLTPEGWFSDDYLGIDQGPIVLMAENHRSGLVWDVMKKNPHVVRGLCRAGFRGGCIEGRCEDGAAAGATGALPAGGTPAPPPPGMVHVPGGVTRIGADDGPVEERPAFDATVAPFFMDEHPVTVAEFRSFVEATGYVTDAERLGDAGVLDVRTGEWRLVPKADWRRPMGLDKPPATDDHPVTQVSWRDASAYAAWAGKRLPTEVEWEHAARGARNSRTRYPWGESLLSRGRYQANTWQGTFPGNNTRADGFAFTSPVGTFGRTALGLSDMAGNVWEWTADWFRPYADRDRPFHPHAASARVQRGGSFLCSTEFCHGYRVSARSHATPDTALFHVGFRCVQDLRAP